MFDSYKEKTLNKMAGHDLSKKGHVDAQIKDLVDCINSKKNAFTTSSCAGRIVLVEIKSGKKFDHNWFISSHEPVTFESIESGLDKIDSYPVWFKTEPSIIHVCVRDIESAHKFLTLSKECCFKRTGIISIQKNIIIEMIGNCRIDTIVTDGKEVLISKDYLSKLVNLANESLKTNHENLNKFQKRFNREFE